MNKYLDILNKLQERPPPQADDHIVLVDALNTFIRSFVTLKSMNPGGHHIGGLLGFLRSLGYLTRILDPTRIICVFDGLGSSMNRKSIDPNYKAQREHVKITNWGMYDSIGEEKESMKAQIVRLRDYLECLPVTVLEYQKIEADDIISFIAQNKVESGSRVTLVSSDKDFYQIVRPNLNIFSPIKKELVDYISVSSIVGVHPTNYLIVKALTGDNSDNLQGVKGVGVGSIVKKFPLLVNTPNVDLDVIYEICEKNLNPKQKMFAKIIYEWDKVKRNYDLMNIQTPRLTSDEKTTILNDIKYPSTTFNTTLFLRYLEVDKIEGITINTENWLELFRPLTFTK